MFTLLTAIALSLVGLQAVHRFAVRRAILDQPNWRSSHSVPTPRGAGLAVIAAVLPTWLLAVGTLNVAMIAAMCGVLLTGYIGWLDDRSSLSPTVRIIAYIAAGACLLPLALGPAPVPAWMGWAAAGWWVFWAVSAVNVVNFMDGIDGIIGAQMLVFGAHIALLGTDGGLAQALGLALLGASAGFLAWNWAPAKIFLGDVGSASLGLLTVLGGLLVMREGHAGLVTAFLPLYPLFLDATVTLLRRAARHERVTEAHREHLYQRLANGGAGHARVSALYAVIAAVGVGVAHIRSDSWLKVLMIGGYGSLVVGIGWYLDRRVALVLPPDRSPDMHDVEGA